MLQLEGLTRTFGAFTAIDNLSFSVDKGEVLGFLGPNGAGKSTTMKIVTGFLEADSGRVLVNNLDIQKHAVECRRHMGYLPEGAPLYPEMTVIAFLKFIADMRGLRNERRRHRLQHVAEILELEKVLKQTIGTLSKGYKRRVGLAQAILHDPDILILDEPTDGLDPNQKHEVRQLIRSISAKKAIVLSTHILDEVDAVCSRAIVIDHGRMIADGEPATLTQDGDLESWFRNVTGKSGETSA